MQISWFKQGANVQCGCHVFFKEINQWLSNRKYRSSSNHRFLSDTKKKKWRDTRRRSSSSGWKIIDLLALSVCDGLHLKYWPVAVHFFFLHIHHHPVDMISTTHSRRVQRPAKLQLAAILEKELSQTRRNLPWLSICYQNGWMAPHLSCTHLFHKWPPSRSQGRRVINDSRLVPHLPARTTHAARTKIHWITDADVWIYSRWSRTLCL